jgi:hypothetical protein
MEHIYEVIVRIWEFFGDIVSERFWRIRGPRDLGVREGR